MLQEQRAYYKSEIGWLEIVGTEEVVKAIEFIDDEVSNDTTQAQVTGEMLICMSQLDEYFKGTRTAFSFKLAPEGTEFQKAVWRELVTIPFGETVSYLDIAQALNNEKAVRAVGAANGQNPIVIVVPCHRVIGSNGKLTGYGGGLWRKEWLLNHEGVVVGKQMRLF